MWIHCACIVHVPTTQAQLEPSSVTCMEERPSRRQCTFMFAVYPLISNACMHAQSCIHAKGVAKHIYGITHTGIISFFSCRIRAQALKHHLFQA